MGPLAMMYGWQALLCAAAAYGLTRLLKTVLDLSVSKDRRKASRWLNRVVLPATPVLFGAIWAAIVPLRPEALIEYADAHVSGAWVYLAWAAWGGACGQFSTMLYQKLKDFIEHDPAKQ